MSRLPLVILGASGHAKVVAFIVRAEGRYEVAGFIDDVSPGREVELFEGARVYTSRDAIESLRRVGVVHALVAIGNNEARMRLAQEMRTRGYVLARAIHPSAVVADGVSVGEGTVVAAGCVVHPGTRLGDNVIVNTSAAIDHDCVIGDGVHVAPGCVLAGRVTVGRLSMIGAGAVIRDGISIGERVTVGAGSVVVDCLPDGVTAYGVPARVSQNVSGV